MKDWKKRKAFLLLAILILTAVFVLLYAPESFAQSKKSVQLTVGKKIYYGTYYTSYFRVDGKMAYCLEPLKDAPGSGSYEVSPLESGSVRKGLYYVYGGPGYDAFREQYGPLGDGSDDEEYCMSHCILAYLYSGGEDSFTGLKSSEASALKKKAEAIRNMPDPPRSFYAFMFNMDGEGQTMGGTGVDRTGDVEVQKSSGSPEWTQDNECYSLKGAEFGIYEAGAGEPRWTVVTDDKGYAKLSDIPIGSYEIVELKSPAGFAIDAKRYKITVKEGAACRYHCSDKAQYHAVKTLIKKLDEETGSQKPQGGATLEGAEFEVKFYGGYYDKDPALSGAVPMRTWKLKTDVSGQLTLSDKYKVSGDSFFKNQKGENVLPLGTVTIRETKAPKGYLINDAVFAEKITSDGDKETETVYHVPEIPEKIIRGGIQIVKFRESADDEEEHKSSLKGICFVLTSQTTGGQIEIVTDENGYASTPVDEQGRGSLVYDTYTVSEKNAPEGLKPAKDFKVVIEEDGRTLYYILENKQIFSPVRVVKKDADTGETIPVSGAEFELLDEKKQPVTMTTYYPQEVVHSTFKTDGSGTFVLPEKLPAGTYYLREVRAPEGYLLGEKLLAFEIVQGHDWSEPFVAEFTDRPAMGRICIKKTDGETEEAVPGAIFEIRAGEDMLTPEGNIRVEAGALMETLETGADGTARSDQLYLGKYEIREVKQAEGYALSEEAYEVELQYRDQETEIVTETVEISNKPTTVIIAKTEKDTGEPVPGTEFTLWKERPEEDAGGQGTDGENETDGREEEIYVTDEEGRIALRYLSPGNYSIQETKSAPGYRRDDTVREFTVDENGMIEGEAGMEIKIENRKTKIKDTSAFWKESKAKEIPAGEGHAIVDTVILEDLDVGQKYTLRGILADPDTGEPLARDGILMTAEKTWKAKEASLSMDMEFDVDSSYFPGKSIVVFEYLYIGDTLISSHEDTKDEGQSVSVLKRPDVSIATGDSLWTGAGIAAALAGMAVPAVYFALRLGKRKKRRS